MVDLILSPPEIKPADRSANKPIYIVVASDPTVKSGIQEYKAESSTDFPYYIEIRGYELATAQAQALRRNPYDAKVKPTQQEINRKIPWASVIRIENITYKKAQQRS